MAIRIKDYGELLRAYVLLLMAYAGLLRLLRRRQGYKAKRDMYPDEATLKFHPALAVLLRDVELAIILHKIYDWMESNRVRNSKRHLQRGRWWTAGSYKYWQEKEFTWMSWQTVRAKFQKLEELGLVISDALTPGSSAKWYTLDDRVFSLIRGDSDLVEGGLNVSLPLPKFSPGGTQVESTSIYKTKEESKRGIKASRRGAAEKKSSIAPALDGLDSGDYMAAREHKDGEPPPGSAEPPAIGEGSEHENAWRLACGQMEALFAVQFDTWLRTAEYRGFADGRMTVAVKSEHGQRYCQHKLYRNIMRVVGDISPDVKAITFVVEEDQVAA